MLRSISVSSRSSTLLCSNIFGLCPIPPVPHYAFPLSKPSRNLSEPLSGKRPPIKWVQLTDIHVDMHYVVGSNPNCHQPVCCRDSPNPQAAHQAGPYGQYKCDTPLPLLHSALDAIRAFAPDAHGIIYTGDAIDHTVWQSTRAKVEEAVTLAYDSLDSLEKPVYGAVGNHDVHPVNGFPRSTSHTPHAADWTYDLHAELWKKHIGHHSAEQSRRHHSGSYSVLHSQHHSLRIISLNTNHAYRSNFWVSLHFQTQMCLTELTAALRL